MSIKQLVSNSKTLNIVPGTKYYVPRFLRNRIRITIQIPTSPARRGGYLVLCTFCSTFCTQCSVFDINQEARDENPACGRQARDQTKYCTKYQVQCTKTFKSLVSSSKYQDFKFYTRYQVQCTKIFKEQNLRPNTNPYLVLGTWFFVHGTVTNQIYFGRTPSIIQNILKTSALPLVYKIFLPTFAASILTQLFFVP